MEQVNQRLSDENLPALEMSVAVHSGEVVAGNIGSYRRAKYGTRGGEILCSEETIREVGDFFEWEERGEICLKGVDQTMKTFLVRGLKDQT
jgi:adenylate cyclase